MRTFTHKKNYVRDMIEFVLIEACRLFDRLFAREIGAVGQDIFDFWLDLEADLFSCYPTLLVLIFACISFLQACL